MQLSCSPQQWLSRHLSVATELQPAAMAERPPAATEPQSAAVAEPPPTAAASQRLSRSRAIPQTAGAVLAAATAERLAAAVAAVGQMPPAPAPASEVPALAEVSAPAEPPSTTCYYYYNN